jgi:hypothetical protein
MRLFNYSETRCWKEKSKQNHNFLINHPPFKYKTKVGEDGGFISVINYRKITNIFTF